MLSLALFAFHVVDSGSILVSGSNL